MSSITSRVDARAGEVVGLGGLLGSGRSETAKAIYGAQPLDEGTVEVAGNPVRSGSPRAAISAGFALIPEDRKAEGIVPTLSVRDNIVLAALPALSRAGFVSERRQDAVVERLMARLRIKASGPDQRVGELSGGNQQKVLLARVLCLDPRVLILDDPTRGIDVGAKAEIQALISDLAAQGMAVVLISSELEEVVEGSDRIVVLRDGAVVGTLSGDEVSEDGVMTLIASAAREAEPLVADAGRAGRLTVSAELAPRRRGDPDRARSWTGSPSEASTSGLLAADRVQPGVHAPVRRGRQHPPAVRPGRAGRDHRPRHGPGHRHQGHRPVGRLGHGHLLGAPRAVPRLRPGRRDRDRDRRRCGGRCAERRSSSRFFGIQPIVATLALLVGGRGLALVFAQGRLTEIFDPTLGCIGSGRVLRDPDRRPHRPGGRRCVVAALVSRTTFGRYVVAIGGNPEASVLAGVPVRRTLITVYVLCAILAALAGVIQTARLSASDPSFVGNLIELSAITAVVVGGTPLSGGRVRIVGTLAGAMLMQLISATLITHNLPGLGDADGPGGDHPGRGLHPAPARFRDDGDGSEAPAGGASVARQERRHATMRPRADPAGAHRRAPSSGLARSSSSSSS